jgi:hypothetical protein
MKKYFLKKISEGKGKGTFIFENFEKEAPFKIEFYFGREALIFMEDSFFSEFSVQLHNLHNQRNIEASLFGEMDNGSKISIDKIILVNVSGIKKGKSTPTKFKVFSPIIISNENLNGFMGKTEFHYYITNFEFTGCERTILHKGGGKLDHFSVSLEGYAFQIRQIDNYKEIIDLIKKNKTNSITAEIVVKADLKEKDKLYPIITNMCNLLSFATGNSVVPITEEHFFKGKQVWSQTNSMWVDSFRSGDQLVPHLPPEAIRYFMAKAYPNYVNLKDQLGLNVLFDYYLLMKSNPILDVRCLMGFILLECLSDHAQEFYLNSGKPIENNIKKSKIKILDKILPKSNNLSKKTKNKLIQELVYQFPSLQDSIKRLMDDYGMKYKSSEADIWKLRKNFIHKGMYPKNTKNHIQIYRDLVHFIDRLLLHILGYDGEFLNIANKYEIERLKFSIKNELKQD